jgi:hypothetical protein
MGTALLGILCGHWRCTLINAVRGDGVNPCLVGIPFDYRCHPF